MHRRTVEFVEKCGNAIGRLLICAFFQRAVNFSLLYERTLPHKEVAHELAEFIVTVQVV
jgi:hypothetical protein